MEFWYAIGLTPANIIRMWKNHLLIAFRNLSRNKAFSVINILGLVGLLSFMVEQKTKEIGVRKVIGASIVNISYLLSRDFLRLIVIAFLIAAPVAWYIMNQWLKGFAYQTAISWWVFAATVGGAIFITGVAVGYQTIRAALANPVRSLRSE